MMPSTPPRCGPPKTVYPFPGPGQPRPSPLRLLMHHVNEHFHRKHASSVELGTEMTAAGAQLFLSTGSALPSPSARDSDKAWVPQWPGAEERSPYRPVGLTLRVGGDVHDWKQVRLATRGPYKERKARGFTVVSSHKGVAVGAPLLPVDVLLRLLKCDVHVAVDGLQLAWLKVVSAVSAVECPHSPLYTTPELSFTVTGLPMIWLRKPDGSLPSLDGAPFSMMKCGLQKKTGLVSLVRVDFRRSETEQNQDNDAVLYRDLEWVEVAFGAKRRSGPVSVLIGF